MTEDMAGRVCLVTGATSGIGEATARALAGMGARVIVHGRDVARCERTVDAIREQSGNPNVEAVVADFASLGSVRELAAEMHQRTDCLHVLINNAGAMYPERRESVDGIELTLAVNHLAPFLLTNLVIDLLQVGAPSRVVNVASGAARRATLDFADLQSQRGYEGRAVYARAKLMNILFTRELARRVAPTSVMVNAISPGLVHTEFGLKDGFGQDQRDIMDRGATPDEGARTSVYVATAPELQNLAGQYYQDCAPAELPDAARVDEVAARLWEASTELVGLGDKA
jgi:retinol dehydrogenase 12